MGAVRRDSRQKVWDIKSLCATIVFTATFLQYRQQRLPPPSGRKVHTMAIADNLHTLFEERREVFEIVDSQPTDANLHHIVEEL